MDIQANWSIIKTHFNRSFSSNFHVAVASVNQHGNPTVTPIGSLFLNSDQTGFYFEKFPSKLPEHALSNPNICVLAVNSSAWFWLKSLFTGQFKTYPAIKLYGQLGIRRKATELENQRLQRRMRFTRRLRGNAYLWGKMEFIREVRFTSAEKIELGRMTAGL